jgi:hypothetical protein
MKKLSPLLVVSILAACATPTGKHGWGDSGNQSPPRTDVAAVTVQLPHALGGGTRVTHATSHATPARTWPLGLRRGMPHPPARGGEQAEVQPMVLPASVDLSQGAPVAGDQGQTGSCATFATGYSAMGWWDARTSLGGAPYAPMFLYAQQVQGDCSSGTSIEGDLDIMKSQGIDTAADYEPMEQDLDCATQPTVQNLAVAAKYKVLDYENPDMSDPKTAIVQELAAGRPLVLGIEVYDNFFNATASDYLIGAPGPGEGSNGGHGITAFKYDANGVWILNSWGTSWGLQGWGELSWDFIEGANCVDDVVAITGVVGGAPPTPPPVTDGGAPDASPPPPVDASPAPAPDAGPTPTPSGGPTIAFESPNDGDTMSAGGWFEVLVDVADANAYVTDVQMIWTSPSGQQTYELGDWGDGQAGIDLELSWGAQPGPRTVTVVATDSNGATGQGQVTVQVQ